MPYAMNSKRRASSLKMAHKVRFGDVSDLV
jgi:hypothetical protein